MAMPPTPPNPGTPVNPGAPIPPTYAGSVDMTQPAAPSQLTGRKLLFIVLGIVGALVVLGIGAIAATAILGIKIFEAVR